MQLIKIGFKYLTYCTVFGAVVAILSFLTLLYLSNTPITFMQCLRYSIVYGVFMVLMGGELIVLALFGYTLFFEKKLLNKIKFKNIIVVVYVLIIFLIILGISNFHRIEYRKNIFDWINVFQLNGWGEIATIIVGIIIYYREVRPLFVKYI